MKYICHHIDIGNDRYIIISFDR